MLQDVAGATVEVSWLPLGAGGHVVRLNGRLFERLAAWRARRQPLDLYHAALEVRVDGRRHVVEMAPAGGVPAADRGVVREGPVGLASLGRFRAFRYEVRCWQDGRIPDLDEAVDSPQHVVTDPARARSLLALTAEVPPLVWGRDERRTGDMWNSNSLVAWLLARSGHDVASVHLPPRGRAPGWQAGLVVAGIPQEVRP